MDEVIANRPLSKAADALQGTVPGLLVSSNGNAPGKSKSFQIRGAYSVGIKMMMALMVQQLNLWF